MGQQASRRAPYVGSPSQCKAEPRQRPHGRPGVLRIILCRLEFAFRWYDLRVLVLRQVMAGGAL
eukprot:1754250-Lingulodinium_polyedra.AAC.1